MPHRPLCLPAFLFFAIAAFAASASAAERNIILFITDDESPTLGCYGDRVAVTPAVDALAADGMLFRNAFATTASCSASRSVVLSGLHNHKNGQFGHQHHYHKFASFAEVSRLALPRVLAEQGYRTGQIGKYHVAPEEVYHFETYLNGGGRNVVATAEKCREFIAADDSRPFFLYFATDDPHRGGGVDQTSPSQLKPNLFGNQPQRGHFPKDQETFFDPAKVPVPEFMTDNAETREELAQYYQACSRIDRGLARLVEILKEAGVYEKTMIVFTSDHGMAFSGAKTAVYEPSLLVPLVVRNPYASTRGGSSDSLVSHVDLTPTLLDFAGGLDRDANAPKKLAEAPRGQAAAGAKFENRDGGFKFDSYQGRSWLDLLDDPAKPHWPAVFASHTFHEIQMYYPMRVVRDDRYKLIWNVAHELPYPFASDLWIASSWQSQYLKGAEAPYGRKTVGEFIHRPEFELYDMHSDRAEANNLADDPAHAQTLEKYKKQLKQLQVRFDDPWVQKWDYE